VSRSSGSFAAKRPLPMRPACVSNQQVNSKVNYKQKTESNTGNIFLRKSCDLINYNQDQKNCSDQIKFLIDTVWNVTLCWFFENLMYATYIKFEDKFAYF
jgi:hypothetical protein